MHCKKTHKKLVEDVHLYTSFLLNPYIPKTSNPLEEYYRQTDPRKMKKRYKTIPGLIRALNLKAVYWIVRHGYISEKESLRIARHYLGRHYNENKPVVEKVCILPPPILSTNIKEVTRWKDILENSS